MTDVLFPECYFGNCKGSLEYGASRWGTRNPFLWFLETARCLRSRITWMRRLENHNLVRFVAAVANGLLRMCVDASVENSASPHRPFRLQPRTWFPVQGHHSRGERLVAAAVKGSVSLTNQFNLSEDISIHVSLRRAYLRCGIRVVGKFQRHADSSVCNTYQPRYGVSRNGA